MNALILIGGKSTRMGKDKSKLIYFNKPQYQHVFNLLSQVVSKKNIFYAVSKNTENIPGQLIKDIYPDLGPFGAIYSAFNNNSSKAWMVLAIDLPYITLELLKKLIKHRDPLKYATTFQGNNKKYPEPLITIWEPKIFPLVKENLENKNHSLIQLLKNNAIKTILIDDEIIENINTIQSYENVKSLLRKG